MRESPSDAAKHIRPTDMVKSAKRFLICFGKMNS